MNTSSPVFTRSISQPEPEAPRHAASSLAGEFERMRECEANLRTYEARLRAWQDQLDRGGAAGAAKGGSGGPFPGDAALAAAWQKLHRSRELLDAESANLRDERIAAQEREADLKRREQAVAVWEHQLACRERRAAEAQAAAVAVSAAIAPVSALERLTRAPFAFARAVLSAEKPAA